MKLIVFDIDGTLVDSQNFIVEAQKHAFASVGMAPPSRKRALSVVGLSLAEAFFKLTDGNGPIDKLTQAYKKAWTEFSAYDDPLYDGASETIAALAGQSNCLLGVATGKSRAGVRRLMDRYGWNDWFVTVQTSDDAPSKPAPDMLLQAMSETGVSAQDICMVGDTTYDMEMAQSVGACGIGVEWGYHPHQMLRDAGAASIAPDFAALRRRLDQFLNVQHPAPACSA